MIGTPPREYHHDDGLTPCVLSMLREMLGNHPHLTDYSVETLARRLWEFGNLPPQPEDREVKVALEALRVEGEVLP